jgi:RNA polymerase sigma factor (sigma-70 family)
VNEWPDSDEGFDGFYRAEFGRLMGAMALLCGERGAAEDIVQETFLRAYRSWPRIANLERPAGWLYVTAFNLVKRRRRLRGPVPVQPSVFPDATARSADRLAVVDALARLPLRQRQAVVARHVLGWSSEEAASALGITPGSLRVTLHRGMEGLRGDSGLAEDMA